MSVCVFLVHLGHISSFFRLRILTIFSFHQAQPFFSDLPLEYDQGKVNGRFFVKSWPLKFFVCATTFVLWWLIDIFFNVLWYPKNRQFFVFSFPRQVTFSSCFLLLQFISIFFSTTGKFFSPFSLRLNLFYIFFITTNAFPVGFLSLQAFSLPPASSAVALPPSPSRSFPMFLPCASFPLPLFPWFFFWVPLKISSLPYWDVSMFPCLRWKAQTWTSSSSNQCFGGLILLA